MHIDIIRSCFLKHRELHLSHRYITHKHIEPLLSHFKKWLDIKIIGNSVLNHPIYGFTIGSGSKRILMWSQMHGNESTTTKALFDLLNTLLSDDDHIKPILEQCTIYVIPILNPDGALAYTRVNANLVDLNRDAQDLTQPESQVLRAIFNTFKPHYCYNLHGQRTIFSAGKTNKPATVSFLSPAQDQACTVTTNRKMAMEVISVMNDALQQMIPGQVGVYDDAFNLNCVGDTFQSENVPTLLFEAGHYEDDYARDVTREYIYASYLVSLQYIALNTVTGHNFASYFNIPENDKLFFDVIIRNVNKEMYGDGKEPVAIGFLYQEQLVNGQITFMPKIEKIANLDGFFGHNEIDAHGAEIFDEAGRKLKINNENVCVMLNNEKISLLPK